MGDENIILSNSRDETADYLESRLSNAGVPVLRLNTDCISEDAWGYHNGIPLLYLSNGQIKSPSNFKHVVFRRPHPVRVASCGDAAQQNHMSEEWSECLEGFLGLIPLKNWFNHPSRNYIASHKLEQLYRAAHFGLSVPDSVVTSKPEIAHAFFLKYESDGIVAKTLSGGWFEREYPWEDSMVHTVEISSDHEKIFQSLPLCPVLFQKKIDKQIDIRVIVIDDSITAVGMRAFDGEKQRLDIRRNLMNDVSYSKVIIPDQIREAILMIVKSYELRFAALDFALDISGNWIFFEINPNGQWAWLDFDGETDIAQTFIEIFRKNTERV